MIFRILAKDGDKFPFSILRAFFFPATLTRVWVSGRSRTRAIHWRSPSADGDTYSSLSHSLVCHVEQRSVNCSSQDKNTADHFSSSVYSLMWILIFGYFRGRIKTWSSVSFFARFFKETIWIIYFIQTFILPWNLNIKIPYRL